MEKAQETHLKFINYNVLININVCQTTVNITWATVGLTGYKPIK